MAKYMNKPKVKTSKRQSSSIRKSVENKVKSHNRKVKKEARKMKALGIYKKKNKKENPLPNLFPFKAQVIESLQRKKKAKDEEKKLQKLKNKPQVVSSELDLAGAANRSNEFEEKFVQNYDSDQDDNNPNALAVNEKRKYVKELKKVLESSDIILEILDARDPLGCRCREIEAQIQGMSQEKKIILVLNKIDLVPTGNADAWLKYLRREYATVLFKANTQQQSTHLSQNTLYKKSLQTRENLTEDLLNSSKSVGSDTLLQLIKNYSKNSGIKQAVTVGVIGYPNVGKSSLINSLKKSKAAAVSSTPGFTKNVQEIQIDSKVTLLDSPGVIFSEEGEKSLVLRNIIKIENVVDPISPIEEILKKVKKNDLLLLYKIPDFNNAKEFIISVAMSRGKLKQGGLADLESAARLILFDWNSGRIKFFSIPPGGEDVAAIETEN